MDSLWWWIFFGAIGLLGCLLGCIENYNFRKIYTNETEETVQIPVDNHRIPDCGIHTA